MRCFLISRKLRKYYVGAVITSFLLFFHTSYAQESARQPQSNVNIEKQKDHSKKGIVLFGNYSYEGIVTALKANLEGQECTGIISGQGFKLSNCDTVSAGEVMRILNASYILQKKISVVLEGNGAVEKPLFSARYLD